MATDAVKVVVYVHADTVRELRRRGQDPKVWARGVVYEAADKLKNDTDMTSTEKLALQR